MGTKKPEINITKTRWVCVLSFDGLPPFTAALREFHTSVNAWTVKPGHPPEGPEWLHLNLEKLVIVPEQNLVQKANKEGSCDGVTLNHRGEKPETKPKPKPIEEQNIDVPEYTWQWKNSVSVLMSVSVLVFVCACCIHLLLPD